MSRVGAVILLLAACLLPVTPAVADGRDMSATIRYTEYGVPHVRARDHTSLGFGTGYAAARDNVCLIAQGVVTLRGERSRYFGANGAPDESLSSATTNLASDTYFRTINDSGVVERLLTRPYPYGPRPEVRELSRGWAAGYNRFLREGAIRDPACAGARWLTPITEIDVHRRAYALTVLLGSGLAADEMIAATPPARTSPSPRPRDAVRAARAVRRVIGGSAGSNAIAVGGGATTTGRGLLLGNPHFPWHTGRRFWQVHQTIPGRLDVSGAAVLGSPIVSMGFNGIFAWSHTVASGMVFSLTQLRLAPGDPTSYVVDGRRERMTRREVTVQARQPDGSVRPVTRVQWWTRYGPVITSLLGELDLPWTTSAAFALSDPNRINLRFMNTDLELGTAGSTGDALRTLKRTQGMPWVNTIAADARGKALYAQQQVLPNIPDAFAQRCNTALGRQIFPHSGLAVLDGSREVCTPGQAPGALQPGILAPDRYPVLERPDYVTNSNDSHWLTNPAQPLEGFDRIIGDERTERSLRTRSGLVAMRDRLATGPFTRAAMQGLVLSNRDLAGALAAGDTVRMCRALGLGEPCEALRRWDRRSAVGSRGALLFERYWRRAVDSGADVWKVPFRASDPVGTPRVLNTGAPAVRKALTDAVAELNASGIPFDAPLGRHQYVVRQGKRIPIGGGDEHLGVLNLIQARWTPGKGYTEVDFGSSYLQVVSFDGDRCPDARTLLTYAQSADPTSSHFADQTRLFSRGRWAVGRFCEKDIVSAPGLKVVRITDRRP
ncbi:MAG TPA: penicillin acylase family protein [Thermomonospora sp.]|nr:penicillin acylase family protein [Thermomonospora sp.]